ncbi:MAG: aminopeptidase [Erysipelotrichaceae bacterium]|nr:aminopeptidase [Erysipelotrichaceae bacterium]
MEYKESILKEFARLAVINGVNVQKGQPLVIDAPVDAYAFVKECVKVAYEQGASLVYVNYTDEDITRLNYEYAPTEVLARVPSWQQDRYQDWIDQGVCMLHIVSSDPDLLNGIDPEKIKTVRMARMKAMHKYQYYTMNNIGQWSIVAWPNLKWAKKVFPDKDDEEAVQALWDAILFTSRVEEGKTMDNWDVHNKQLRVHSKLLNDYAFKELYFRNSLGTDLRVGLIKDHIWEGGSSFNAKGAEFHPNIPTEEVFTMPDRRRINGTVYASKPLSYGGNLIKDFSFTFKDGVVVDYDAKEGKEVLKGLLDTDEGSKSLGEAALISYDSPISKSGILFYDTLFDENASCHLALGACYPENVKGGLEMSQEDLYELGGNDSLNHVDFMFGTEDLEVTGITWDGKEVPVFAKGNFVF